MSATPIIGVSPADNIMSGNQDIPSQLKIDRKKALLKWMEKNGYSKTDCELIREANERLQAEAG